MNQASTGGFPTFSLAERDRRWNSIRAFMEKVGVDVVLIMGERDGAGPPLFNPDTWTTSERPGSITVFPREGEPVVHVWNTNVMADHMEAVRRGDQVWITPDQHRFGKTAESLAGTIVELGLDKSTVGMINLDRFGPFYPEGSMPWTAYENLRAALPGATFKSVGHEFQELMLIHSEEEIVALRKCAAIGEAMCEAAIAVAGSGVSEAEVYAETTAAAYREGGTSYWMIMISGPDPLNWGPPAWTFRPQAPRILESGDLLMLELFPMYGGYETQQQLSIAIGDVHPDTEKAAEGAKESYERGMELLKPGTVFEDLVDAMDEPVLARGGWSLTPNIHTLPPDAAGRNGIRGPVPELDAYPGPKTRETFGGDLVLAPGWAFAFEPNCVIGRHRVNIGGTVVMTEDGCEEMNSLANGLNRVD
jgi:Xaa-Pro aminopeptidase